MKEETIKTTMSMGDAGWPLDVSITVWYDEVDGEIHISDSEDDAPFDNPPINWENRIKEKIDDHFHPKVVKFI